jgi:hypothetical protein
MARTISQIQTQINLQIQTDPTLGPLLTSTSQTALWNVFSFVVATAIALFEQLQDVFKTEIEAEIASQPPGTPEWVVKEMLAFQYSETTPQVVVFTNGVPGYPVVNPDLQIVAHCAVETSSSTPGRAIVKLAQADTTSPLTQGVTSITITAAGAGYTSAPTYQITNGGYGATGATLTMPAPPYTIGQVINTTSQGSGYSQTPNVIFNGGGGTGLGAVATLNSALAAAQAYMDVIGFTGINYQLISLANDWLIVDAKIQFDGQYTFTVVQSNVQNAISNYLSNLPFNGVITLTDLIVTIKSVPGVIDIEFSTVTETDNTGSNAQAMVVSGQVISPQAGTQAGTALFETSLSSITYTTNPL